MKNWLGNRIIDGYVGVIYKVKHYANNQSLRLLYHTLINSRVLYEIIAWERAASPHIQPISVVLNRAMRCLNTHELATRKVSNIYKTQKILQLKDIYNLEVSKFMCKYTNSQLLATFNNYFKLITDEFIRIMQDKPKLGNLLYQKHVQTQVRKC